MAAIKRVREFVNDHFTRLDKLLYLLILANALCGSLFILTNTLVFKYTGQAYIGVHQLLMLPFVLLLSWLAIYARTLSPKTSLIIYASGMAYCIITALGICETGMQYTPFPLIDRALAAFDASLSLSSPSITQWTLQHIWLKHILVVAYDSVLIKPAILILVLGLLLEKKRLHLFLLTTIISDTFLVVLYYFFPSNAPASFYSSNWYSYLEHTCEIKFYAAHHHFPVLTHAMCFISFPSPHVTFALVSLLAFRVRWWLFVPFCMINGLEILATVMLGFHYFADVFGACVLVFISVTIANRLYHWCLNDPHSATLLT